MRVRIPDLGIDVPIYEGDGVTAKMGKAAHLPGTGWPGSGTLIYLYAHAQDGMFLPLWDAKVGEAINLELADGDTVTYTISNVRRKVAYNDFSMLQPTTSELLRLQTCTSNTDTAPRFIVEAVPAP